MSAWELWQATKKDVYESEHSTYSRSTSVQIGQAECEICKETTTIMSVDSSDGEYNSFDCCKPCLEKLWSKHG
jgi:hypothetical protein